MLGLIVTSFSCRRFLSVSSTYGFVGCDASVGSLFYEIFTSANVRDFQSKRVNACTVLLQSAYAFFGVCCRVASAKAKPRRPSLQAQVRWLGMLFGELQDELLFAILAFCMCISVKDPGPYVTARPP